jgi:hypothetical protein
MSRVDEQLSELLAGDQQGQDESDAIVIVTPIEGGFEMVIREGDTHVATVAQGPAAASILAKFARVYTDQFESVEAAILNG